jgi:DNA-binding response OmpR family regulator
MHLFKKILVIDEDSEVADELTLLLKASTQPVHIVTTYSESHAIHLLNLGDFDIVLLPLRFGHRGGEQFALSIRRPSNRKRPKLIALAMQQEKIAATPTVSAFDMLVQWPMSGRPWPMLFIAFSAPCPTPRMPNRSANDLSTT